MAHNCLNGLHNCVIHGKKKPTMTDLTTLNTFIKIMGPTRLFSGLSELETIPEGALKFSDTSGVTDLMLMFENCSGLTEVPLFDTSSATNMSMMFYECSNLTTVPLFDTSNVTDISNMFYNCTNLTTVPELDVRNAKFIEDMFFGCPNLTNCWIKNIRGDLSIGDCPISYDSALHMIGELVDTGTDRTLMFPVETCAELDGVYVKLIDITDEMRAEDDLIDSKLPFEVCESTDEGAMLITDYALLKKWTVR